MKEQTIQTETFEGALRDALDLGFTTAETEIGTHRLIEDMLSEMETGTTDPAEYALFGSYIVRVTDAWDINAEVIALN